MNWFWRYVKDSPFLAALELTEVLLAVIGMPVAAWFLLVSLP